MIYRCLLTDAINTIVKMPSALYINIVEIDIKYISDILYHHLTVLV